LVAAHVAARTQDFDLAACRATEAIDAIWAAADNERLLEGLSGAAPLINVPVTGGKSTYSVTATFGCLEINEGDFSLMIKTQFAPAEAPRCADG
jgi:hypothetical protein